MLVMLHGDLKLVLTELVSISLNTSTSWKKNHDKAVGQAKKKRNKLQEKEELEEGMTTEIERLKTAFETEQKEEELQITLNECEDKLQEKVCTR